MDCINVKEELIKELEFLLSGKSMKPLSGLPKKCYKYALSAVFINICFGKQLTKGQEKNFEWVYSIKKEPKEFNKHEILKGIQSTVENSLEDSQFYNHKDYETIDKIIDFFRQIVSETKKHGTFLVNVSEVNCLFNTKKVFEASHKHLQPHHWLEIDIYNGMVITVPDFFTYSDIVNNWNMFVDKLNEYKMKIYIEDGIPLIEKKNDIKNRQLKYEIDTLSKNLWICSVTFVESYLYYLFYNLKQLNYEPKTQAGKVIMELHKVEDEQIIKRLVLPEFINGQNNELKKLVKNYIEINKVRNRFIHPSAFQNASEKSELLPLITNSYRDTVDTLETCRRLVEIIDGNLPEELKILVWWNRIAHPVFKDYKKGSITNADSTIGRIKYTE